MKSWRPTQRRCDESKRNYGFVGARHLKTQRTGDWIWLFPMPPAKSSIMPSSEKLVTKRVLIDLPSSEIERLIAREEIHLAICDEVMYLRPQSLVDVAEPSDETGPGSDLSVEFPARTPVIAALLDGFPVQNHELLRDRIDVDDADGLEPMSVVADRFHGTAMASLILHGDRNRQEPSIQHKTSHTAGPVRTG